MGATLKQLLMNYLDQGCRGKAHAATRDELKTALACDDRKIRELIAELRISGIPIAARSEAPGGYFIPVTREEALEAVEDWRGRARKLLMAAAGVTKGMCKAFPNEKQLILNLMETAVDDKFIHDYNKI